MVELLNASGKYFYGEDGVEDKRPQGDNSKYLLNLWRQEVFLSLEATENVTKI